MVEQDGVNALARVRNFQQARRPIHGDTDCRQIVQERSHFLPPLLNKLGLLSFFCLAHSLVGGIRRQPFGVFFSSNPSAFGWHFRKVN